MANMSYCRFENTLEDLQACREHLDDNLSEREEKARRELVELCTSIAEEGAYLLDE